jgi:hypothetical protein
MISAYYSETIANFLRHESMHILGVLAAHHQFALEDLQRNAWIAQIEILKHNLVKFSNGHILLEYSIPRMGKRVDAVLLVEGVVFVIEFKVGDNQYTLHALDQVLDYALDLKNFHAESHSRTIVPLVVATEADAVENFIIWSSDKVAVPPLKANQNNLSQVIDTTVSSVKGQAFDPIAWQESVYRPTPTIIEAAQALYRGHSVEAISNSGADKNSLSLTSEAISAIIDDAKTNHRKAICFVTGVPGAGKTLAGLNIANERLRVNEDEHAVFISGNGPLVRVLREALVRNELEGLHIISNKLESKRASFSKVEAFIQNMHHFRDYALGNSRPPHERVAVFDEAQRAWTREQTASFMARKRNVPDFPMSEPQFLISVMDRHLDWAVIVCLVGGGQEINTGEAGLLEWFDALRIHYRNWHAYFSPNLTDDEYTRGEEIAGYFGSEYRHIDSRLHLAVSVRSFRAESVSSLVKAILDNDVEKAQILCRDIDRRYPIVLTRDIDKAREWLRKSARGTERYGLLASSGAIRLRPIGINVQVNVDVIPWFLNSKSDVRSSYYLEDVATEFDVQGLELDWSCVAWDADLRYAHDAWDYKAFRGTTWQNVNDSLRRRYLKNAYRVLLTRARQGMVILVPHGSSIDETRKPEYYDGTFAFLKQIGFEVL